VAVVTGWTFDEIRRLRLAEYQAVRRVMAASQQKVVQNGGRRN
jgi:hypothetical protein